jgi:ABC-type multidrug transport system ATPase subunit
MANPDQPLSVQGAMRRYGKRLALESVDLEIKAGEIVGLVGPNGSGKTTLLKIVAGFLRPHAGSVRVFGRDPFTHQARVMERARFAFAPPALFDELSPREHLQHLVPMGASLPLGKPELDQVLEQVGLLERAKDRVGTFSFGMRQRLVLALALLPMPGLLVLDEPTDGLDPLGVLNLRRLLLELRSEHGVAVLLSSHLLSEIEELVDSLLVLGAGKTQFYGTPTELTAGLACLRLRVCDSQAGKALFESQGIQVTEFQEQLELPAGCMDAQRAADLLGASNLRLLEFREYRPGLEAALMERMQQGTQR